MCARGFLTVPSVKISIDSRPAFVIETHGRRDAIVSAAIRNNRMWEAASTRITRELLRHDADFIDIGANIGWFSLVAADALGSRGRVHSFEPEPRHVRKLSASVKRNRFWNVIVNDWALSDHDGEGQLYLSRTNWGDHRLFDLGGSRRTERVAVRTLDGYGRIDPKRALVMKLDIQGSEARALRGASGILTGQTGEIVILCEVAPRLLEAAGSSLDELVSFLRDLGFLPALVDQKRIMVHPTTWERVVARCVEGMAVQPSYEIDLLLFRRLDGMAAPALRLGRV